VEEGLDYLSPVRLDYLSPGGLDYLSPGGLDYLSPGRQIGVLRAVWELPFYAALFPFFEDYKSEI
jgi:hypothetical protein